MAQLELVALVVREYDPAIDFFVRVLGFELVEDVPSLTNDGRPKRWVVVRPVGAATGILLARADGAQQESVVGQQFAGRVGLFLRVDDFVATYSRMVAAGVNFVSAPRVEAYGQVAVFLDIAGNRWDLLGAATQMPFKSKAQRRKFAELLVKGEISPETFEEWNRETGDAELPERASRKPAKKRPAAKARAAAKKKRKTKTPARRSVRKSARKRKK